MTDKTIAEISNNLERICLEELSREPGTRPGYFELLITDAEQPFTVRWDAGNVEQIWRTSENYAELDDAVHAIALLPGGREWLASYTPRLVDERKPAPSPPDLGDDPDGDLDEIEAIAEARAAAANTVDDMNPE